MTTLAIDLGTRTGWAARPPGWNKIIHGWIDLRGGRYEGGGMRFLRFERWLDEQRALQPPSEVVFEEVRRHLGVDAAHVYGGLLATLTAWCEKHSIPYRGIPVGTAKRAVTGKGNASKAHVLKAVRAMGYNPQYDDEADAIAVLIAAQQL